MNQSLAILINDSTIQRYAEQMHIVELRDQKHPLMLRYRADRTRGTWYLVRYENRKKLRLRVGYWPTLKTKEVVQMVPQLISALRTGQSVESSRFETVGQLLQWYAQRTSKEVTKSIQWRGAVQSAISAHLMPRLHALPVAQLTKAIIDEQLILPLVNSGLKPSTMRKYWGTLKTAVKLAAKLELLAFDYMAGMKFVDHVTKRIKPKESRLRVTSLPHIIEQLHSAKALESVALCMIMLLFGTRIGETRQLKWSYLDFTAKVLAIPAQITKTEATHVLPLTSLATEFFSRLHKRRGRSQSDFIFPASDEAIADARAQMQVKALSKGKWSAHDLRKFARSAWAELGIDYWMAERLLNHKPKGLDAVYIKTEALSERLKAVGIYHEWLQERGLNVGTVQALKSEAVCSKP